MGQCLLPYDTHTHTPTSTPHRHRHCLPHSSFGLCLSFSPSFSVSHTCAHTHTRTHAPQSKIKINNYISHLRTRAHTHTHTHKHPLHTHTHTYTHTTLQNQDQRLHQSPRFSFYICVSGFGSLGSCVEGPLVGFVSTYYGWGSVFYLMTALSAVGALAVFRAVVVSSGLHRYTQAPDGPVV